MIYCRKDYHISDWSMYTFWSLGYDWTYGFWHRAMSVRFESVVVSQMTCKLQSVHGCGYRETTVHAPRRVKWVSHEAAGHRAGREAVSSSSHRNHKGTMSSPIFHNGVTSSDHYALDRGGCRIPICCSWSTNTYRLCEWVYVLNCWAANTSVPEDLRWYRGNFGRI